MSGKGKTKAILRDLVRKVFDEAYDFALKDSHDGTIDSILDTPEGISNYKRKMLERQNEIIEKYNLI